MTEAELDRISRAIQAQSAVFTQQHAAVMEAAARVLRPLNPPSLVWIDTLRAEP